jgi:hypothetical protein
MSTPHNPKIAEDDFLASIRLDQSYTETALGVRRVLSTVPVRKPGKTDFIRVHPDHFLDCFCVELKAEGEIYFVTPSAAQFIPEFCEPVRLRQCVTRQGVSFLWPLKLPRDDRRSRRGRHASRCIPNVRSDRGAG